MENEEAAKSNHSCKPAAVDRDAPAQNYLDDPRGSHSDKMPGGVDEVVEFVPPKKDAFHIEFDFRGPGDL